MPGVRGRRRSHGDLPARRVGRVGRSRSALGFSISIFLILQLFPTGARRSPRAGASWCVLTIANAAMPALAPALGVTL